MKKFLSFLSIFILPLSFLFAQEPKDLQSEKPVFDSYTGRINATNVRMRTGADIQSPIIKQLNKNDLVLVVGEENEFFCVAPSYDMKVYVFRSYIIDNVVEANRVNIRLQPDLEAPIIGMLQQSQRIDGQIYEKNHKWMEITPPKNVCFFIARDYIEKAGDKNYLSKMEKRKDEVTKLLNSAFFITQEECQKPFNEMTPENAITQFEAIIKGYGDFPEAVKQAKEGLSLLQDTYLQKKISYLESKADIDQAEKEKLLQQVASFTIDEKKPAPVEKKSFFKGENLSDKMKFWNTLEETLFAAWNSFHSEKNVDDFYVEQEITAVVLDGTVESYNKNVKDKPGDYLLKKDGKCVAYLYSTKMDLSKLEGQEVTILGSPRPNNNFAYPAYFAHKTK